MLTKLSKSVVTISRHAKQQHQHRNFSIVEKPRSASKMMISNDANFFQSKTKLDSTTMTFIDEKINQSRSFSSFTSNFFSLSKKMISTTNNNNQKQIILFASNQLNSFSYIGGFHSINNLHLVRTISSTKNNGNNNSENNHEDEISNDENGKEEETQNHQQQNQQQPQKKQKKRKLSFHDKKALKAKAYEEDAPLFRRPSPEEMELSRSFMAGKFHLVIKQFHALAETSPYSVNFVSSAYKKLGKIAQLEKLIESIADKPKFVYIPTYNNLLTQYCLVGDSAKIDGLLESLDFPSMMEAAEFASTRRVDYIKQQARITFNVLLNHMAKNFNIQAMNNVFFQMKAIGLTPDRLSMNLILQAYAKSNDVETVLRIFKSMESFVEPHGSTYAIIFDSLAAADKVDTILALYKNVMSDKSKSMVFSIECFRTVSASLGRAGRLTEMLEIYEEAQKHFRLDTLFHNAIVNYLAKAGKLNEALGLSSKLEEGGLSNVHTYNTLMSAYGYMTKHKEMISLFEQMKAKHEPNMYTYQLLLKTYTAMDDLPRVRQTWNEILNNSTWLPNEKTYRTILHWLAKHNLIADRVKKWTRQLHGTPLNGWQKDIDNFLAQKGFDMLALQLHALPAALRPTVEPLVQSSSSTATKHQNKQNDLNKNNKNGQQTTTQENHHHQTPQMTATSAIRSKTKTNIEDLI